MLGLLIGAGAAHALNRDGVAQDIYLKPGDRIYLPYNDRKQIYVVGEVRTPQAISFKTTDMSLTQALGRAGGLNPETSKGKAVYVIRGMDDTANLPATVYNLDARSPAAFALARPAAALTSSTDAAASRARAAMSSSSAARPPLMSGSSRSREKDTGIETCGAAAQPTSF